MDKFFKVKYHLLDERGNVTGEEFHPIRGPEMPSPAGLILVHPKRVLVRSIEEIDEQEFEAMLPKAE